MGKVVKKRAVVYSIIIIIVLAVLIVYYLSKVSCQSVPGFYCNGVTTNPFLGPDCFALSGYYCQNATYNHNNGNIVVSLGENTGTNWTSANFVFVASGSSLNSYGIPNISFSSPTANTLYYTIGLKTGQKVSLYLPYTGSVNKGVTAAGDIWVKYIMVGANTATYVQIASLKLNAS